MCYIKQYERNLCLQRQTGAVGEKLGHWWRKGHTGGESGIGTFNASSNNIMINLVKQGIITKNSDIDTDSASQIREMVM